MSPRPRLSEVRRYQILEAAAAVIAERGFSDARISDVATRAGASSALILYYFESKDRLLADALTFADERFYANLQADLADMTRARDQLVALIDASCPRDPATTKGPVEEWVLWLDLWARALRDPGIARDRQRLEHRFRSLITEIVRHGQRRGEFRTVDPAEFALRFGALMDGLAIQVLLNDPDVSADRMRQLCVASAAAELGFDST